MKNFLGEFTVTYRRTKIPEGTIVRKSADAFSVISKMEHFMENADDHEMFYVLGLDRAHNVITFFKISEGGDAATYVDPKTVFRGALMSKSQALILVHNHPSGKLAASAQDIRLTEKLQKAGDLLDIKVLDHLIVAGGSYISLQDQGAM